MCVNECIYIVCIEISVSCTREHVHSGVHVCVYMCVCVCVHVGVYMGVCTCVSHALDRIMQRWCDV